MEEVCANCRFYDHIPPDEGKVVGPGRCRRYPPVFVAGDDSAFPRVIFFHWCGEYRPAVVYGEKATPEDFEKALAELEQRKKELGDGLKEALGEEAAASDHKALQIVRRLADAYKGEDDYHSAGRLAAEYFGEGDD